MGYFYFIYARKKCVSFSALISQNSQMCNSIIFRSPTSESVDRNSLVPLNAAFTALFAMKHNKVLETSIQNFLNRKKCRKYKENFIYILK